MLENLVAAWLTDASERSYEAAFAQLLVTEGHTVIQGPMHHAHEHGKDIIAINPDGDLCAYQLKGGAGKLDTASVEEVQQQLFVAAAATVVHPSLPEPRLPARVYLVTNQVATGPAQDRVAVLSQGNVAAGRAPLHLIEKDELLSRFVRAEGRFFPSSPRALNAFLSLFLADGHGPIPAPEFFKLLEAVLPVDGERPSANAAQREISSGALTVSFVLHPWLERENHAEIAMGWVYFCSQVLRCAQRLSLSGARWRSAYRLGLEEARRRLRLLLDECLAHGDIAIGHPGEPLIYGARATKICGLVSALLLSEHADGIQDEDLRSDIADLLRREVPHRRVVGEYQAPEFLLTVLALSRVGEIRTSIQTLFAWIRSVATANARDSEAPLPSPYYPTETVLLGQIAPFEQEGLHEEQFDGYSYTIHVAIRWATRRLWRQSLSALWYSITKVELCSFEPRYPIEYLYYRSPNGRLRTWQYDRPASWSALLAGSRDTPLSSLPDVLLGAREFAPFFALAFPHRLTPDVGDLLDQL